MAALTELRFCVGFERCVDERVSPLLMYPITSNVGCCSHTLKQLLPSISRKVENSNSTAQEAAQRKHFTRHDKALENEEFPCLDTPVTHVFSI